MRIDRLYTINQFIDFIFTKDITLAEKASIIFKYREFLQRPLIGELMYPAMIYEPRNYNVWYEGMLLTNDAKSTEWYNKCLEYHDQKSKIIFPEAWVSVTSKYNMEVYIKDEHIGHVDEEIDEWFNCSTLDALAEMTSGQLRLQNVNFS